MTDPTAPDERRLKRGLMALGMTAEDLGPEATDSLRARLSADDGADIVRMLEAPSPGGHITDWVRGAMSRRGGDQ